MAKDGALPKLKGLYDFMVEHNLETLELDDPGTHVRLVRRRAASPAPIPVPVPMAGIAPGPSAGAAGHGGPSGNALAAMGPPPGAAAVKASMMGIFYRAASPSSPPFVKDGEKVSAGQVLCMIEAMKVFNEIKADFPCVILKACLENGKPVKSGQDLFFVQRL
ncbi:MAG: acetyl-CoA carboxylase, biotin carboxyl carrier protein [Elusimicrobia bacterium]|nr:acetyl-CoA carboxylase, biotin carboxyl carrier protein [Elusimicrobiota bacterium]